MTKKMVLKDHAGFGYVALAEAVLTYMHEHEDRKAKPGFRRSSVVYTYVGVSSGDEYQVVCYWTEGGAAVGTARKVSAPQEERTNG